MSGLSKEQIQRLIDELPRQPVPNEAEHLFPRGNIIAPLLYPAVPNPFTPENGKVYFVQGLVADFVVALPEPTNIERGFAFEILAAGLNLSSSAFNIQIRRTNTGNQFFVCGEFLFDQQTTDVVSIDTNRQHCRVTYIGALHVPGVTPYTLHLWHVVRLDSLLSTTRIVDMATVEPLPPYSSEGAHGAQILTALSGVYSGTLVVDGFSATPGNYDEILVKNEFDASYHGIYKVLQENPWKLRRRSDWQQPSQLTDGAGEGGADVLVRHGDTNARRKFYTHEWGSDFWATKVGVPPVSVQTDEYTVPQYADVCIPYTPATFTGFKRITFPSAPQIGQVIAIKNVSSSTASINLYSEVARIEDPISGGLVSEYTNIPVSGAWFSAVWEYMQSETGAAWHLVSKIV